jgi:hypothetical protein
VPAHLSGWAVVGSSLLPEVTVPSHTWLNKRLIFSQHLSIPGKSLPLCHGIQFCGQELA